MIDFGVFAPRTFNVVGYYWLDVNTKFSVYTRPTWFHRTMMRFFFGFRWEDAK